MVQRVLDDLLRQVVVAGVPDCTGIVMSPWSLLMGELGNCRG
ncbi:MAG: hypothetical protein ACLTTU_00945 [Bilophila wadsworthia]